MDNNNLPNQQPHPERTAKRSRSLENIFKRSSGGKVPARRRSWPQMTESDIYAPTPQPTAESWRPNLQMPPFVRKPSGGSRGQSSGGLRGQSSGGPEPLRLPTRRSRSLENIFKRSSGGKVPARRRSWPQMTESRKPSGGLRGQAWAGPIVQNFVDPDEDEVPAIEPGPVRPAIEPGPVRPAIALPYPRPRPPWPVVPWRRPVGPKIPVIEPRPKIPAIEPRPKIPAIEPRPKIPAIEPRPKVPAIEPGPKIPAIEPAYPLVPVPRPPWPVVPWPRPVGPPSSRDSEGEPDPAIVPPADPDPDEPTAPPGVVPTVPTRPPSLPPPKDPNDPPFAQQNVQQSGQPSGEVDYLRIVECGCNECGGTGHQCNLRDGWYCYHVHQRRHGHGHPLGHSHVAQTTFQVGRRRPRSDGN